MSKTALPHGRQGCLTSVPASMEEHMTGGKATPKKDEALKVSCGQSVKTGQILLRGINTYKPRINVRGMGTMYALCPGKVYFTRKKTPHGKTRTFVNIEPSKEKASA